MSRLNVDFDPRAWNLLTGLALVSACSGRTISVDGDGTDSIVDGETTLNPDSGPDTGPDTGPPECYSSGDCPYGYYCYNGICEYAPHHDGHVPYYDCYSDAECGQLELCEFNYCQYVYSPPLCGFVLPQPPALEIPAQALALAFVDIDDDGAEELIVATQTQLHVYESGSPVPVSHARGIESASVDAMVGDAFDAMAGDDVIVLHDDELDLHVSDGLGNLLPALPSPSPFPGTLGLEAGEWDATPTADLLAWGSNSTGLIYGNGNILELVGGNVTSASKVENGPFFTNGFTLLSNSELLFLDPDGSNTASAFLRAGSPHAQASVNALGQALEVGSSTLFAWTLIEAFDRSSSNLTTRWGLLGIVTHMRAGNLDGFDEIDELALMTDDTLWLQVGGNCLLPIQLDGMPLELAFGDHDGDGDDELAVSTTANTVSIIDVE